MQREEVAMLNISKMKKPNSLNEIAYRSIRQVIIGGKLDFDVLYSEKQLAEMLGISRTPVREALLKLSSEGFVQILRNRGFKLAKFSKSELAQFFETRKMIELFAIRRAITSLTGSDIAKLEIMLAKMEQPISETSDQEYMNIDREFHSHIIRKLHNTMITSIFDNIRDLIYFYGMIALSIDERRTYLKKEHRDIIDALKKHNLATALRKVEYHLDATMASILAVFQNPNHKALRLPDNLTSPHIKTHK
jgi:DNA-binding GntR family transcriptional regulator